MASSLAAAVAASESNPTSRGHWAFQSIADPSVPAVQNRDWPQTDIDRFILAKLEEHRLPPAAPAGKRTLIRRATFDLTGLPPTPEDVERFIADNSPDALARLIDRLLASPAYGERWGRHWLDVARYADSNGMDENLAYASAWRYRDYVVAAFNKDKPYDQFIREQIAGDLLPATGTTNDFAQLIATGFLTIGPKMLAEDDPVKMEMDIIDEQLDTTSRAFMGLTVGCARCHDHKYDPVPTNDYYAMAGIFKSTRTMEHFKVVARWQERPLGNRAEIERLAAHRRRIEDQTRRVKNLVAQANTNLLREARSKAAEYLLAATQQRLSQRRAGETKSAISHIQYHSASTLIPEITAQWIKFLAKTEKETNSALGVWHEWLSSAASSGIGADESWPTVVRRFGASALLGDDPPRSMEELAQRYREAFAQAEEAFRHLESSTTSTNAQWLSEPFGESLRQVLYDPKGPFELPKNAETYYSADRVTELTQEREALQTLEASLPALPEAMSVSEGPAQNLRVHKRGGHLTLGDEVTRGFARSIGAPKPLAIGTNSSGRLQLAEWMTHPEHPLTARVMVNRLWHWHFGEGLVRTPDNFGLLGEKPTHPELLDWLARRFIASGWSIKAMHRLIMASAVYQQASVATDVRRAPVTVDPENRLWSHFNRRRLEAEAIRDSILFVSGGLDPLLGGSLLTITNRAYVTSTANKLDSSLFDQPRRSLYLPVIRSALYDVFQVFDFADPSVLNGHRDQTTVAPQALFMLNSKLVTDAARRLAASLLADQSLDDEGRVAEIYRLAYSRAPTGSEAEAASKYLSSYAQETERRGTKAADSRLKAWQSFARTVMAANEFVYID
jgi:hypothetical protein